MFSPRIAGEEHKYIISKKIAHMEAAQPQLAQPHMGMFLLSAVHSRSFPLHF